MNNKKYKVLEINGHSGLTVGAHVLKAGKIFSIDEWKWGFTALKAAIKNGRCEEISGKKEDKKEKTKQEAGE